MSRIGNRIIMIPEGVTVEENDGVITVKGPKGTLEKTLLRGVKYNVKDNEITLTIENEKDAAMHGTMNALLQNMIIGVTKGYSRGLEIVGVGYRFNVQGSKLIINAGYSHPVSLTIPEGIKAEVKDNTQLTLSGIDKELLGEFAAQVRKVRKPEPYKGKGIRYSDEHIRRKEGKKAA
ncbi:MAG: 50S ribosomal protein L6 [Bacilli bacterium]|nr:50S ribosomal protein L6 [Bacilli bacterium]